MADNLEKLKKIMVKTIDGIMPELEEIAMDLYNHPEIGGKEERTSEILKNYIAQKGFDVLENYYDYPYAFKATYDTGKKGATIGFFAEFDALPEIGHGCGHNLICTSAIAAACGLKSVINELGGKIVLFGTPDEEYVGSKAVLAPKGAFDEADVGIMIHPGSETLIGGTSLALEGLQIEFYGKNAHAANAPEEGINALDAANLFYLMVNLEKQYYPDSNIYGIMKETGIKSNIIPDLATLQFSVRAWTQKTFLEIKDMINRCAQAAALVTKCQYKVFTFEIAYESLNNNRTMTALFEKNLVTFGEKEIEHKSFPGSTDMGNVSNRIPSIHPSVKIDGCYSALHTKEFADATISEGGKRCIERSGKTMAATAIDILNNPAILNKIKDEFMHRDGISY